MLNRLGRRAVSCHRYLSRLSLIPYVLIVTVLSLAARIPFFLVAIAIVYGLEGLTITEGPDHSFVYAFIIGPLIETIIFQWFLIWLVSKWTRRKSVQVIVSTILFSVGHITPGRQLMNVINVLNAIAPGFALAYTFVLWAQRGRHQGLIATTLTHSSFNILVNMLAELVDLVAQH